MESNNMSSLLPMDLFDDSSLEINEKDQANKFNYDLSTNYTGSEYMMKPNYLPMKYKSSQGLPNEEIIKRQLQPFAKKKRSDYSLTRGQMCLQYTQPIYPQYPPMMVMPQRVMPPQFVFVPPKVKTVQSSKVASFNVFNNGNIRMNKKYPTWHNNTYYSNQKFDDEEIYSEMSIKQIIEKHEPLGFISLIKTCKGSKLVQKKMNKIQGYEIDLILSSLINNLKEVMCDYYGNYFLQKFITCCSPQQRITIYMNIKSNFNEIAQNSCGTHSIQGLIVLGNTKEEEALLKEYIEDYLLELSLNDNSTHIIQKALLSIPESRRDYLNNFIISNLIDLSIHSNGICLVKEFISNNQDENLSKMVITVYELDTAKLVCNQFGNFGIQEVIRKFGFEPCTRIIKIIKEKIVMFSSMKYSSNVIDFIISFAHSYNIQIFNEITSNLFFNLSVFNEMTKNKYGNFVLENAILLLDHSTLIKLKEFMSSNGILSLVREKEKKIFKLIRNVMI